MMMALAGARDCRACWSPAASRCCRRRRRRRQDPDDRRALRARADHARGSGRARVPGLRHARAAAVSSWAPRPRRKWSARRSACLAALGAGAVGPAHLAGHGAAVGARRCWHSNARHHDARHSDAGVAVAMRWWCTRRSAARPTCSCTCRRSRMRPGCGGRPSTTGGSTAACRGWWMRCRTARHHPTVQVFLAGGVPEVMLHLRALGLLELDVLTVSGRTLGARARLVGTVRTPRRGFAAAARDATGSIRTT